MALPLKPARCTAGPLLFCLAAFATSLSAPAAQISSFQVSDSGWHLGTLAVANLLGTRDKAIVIPYRDSTGTWYLDAFTYTGQRLPGFPYVGGGDAINTSPTIYDLDHDGRDEIIFTRGNHVIALRGNGSVMWSNTVDYTDYVPDGGYHTVTNGFYWYPTGLWVNFLPPTADFSSQVSPPVVMDLAGNGNPEIITAWKILPDPITGGQDYNPFMQSIYGVGPWGAMGEAWSGGVVTFNLNTGAQNFVYHLHHLVEAGLAVGRPKRTGPLQIYELNDSDSVVCFDKSQPFGLFGKGMLHRQFGKNQRLMTGSYQVPIDVYAADLDGDGLDEALVAGTQLSSMWQPNETVLDDDGTILWRRWLPHLDLVNNFGWLNSASLIPINPDHDNHIDVLGFNHSYSITFRFWNGVELVDRPGWPKNFYPYLPTPPVVGDVDGDGQEEIVIGTYNPSINPSTGNLLIYALDGTLKQTIPVPGGLKHIPALADVEGVGRLDVIYRSLSGQVFVQNFGSTSTNLVSWATHRGNMRRDGNCGVSLYPPGTPFVTGKSSGYNRTSFSWTNSSAAQLYRLYRAEQASGPFLQVATLTANTASYTDYNLRPGWQYFYEVGAVYATNTVLSAPFAVLSLLNSNLIANAGFEENDNSHWDKWFTGTLDFTNMMVSTNVSYQGLQSMQIALLNQGDNSTIAQYNQYGIADCTIYVTPGNFYSYGAWFKSAGISQPSEHWLEWSSTKTGYNTNDRPALPYPFYFTPHFVIGTNQENWTYENRTFQLPPGLPNIELRHRYTIAAPGSGSMFLDNVFFRQIPSPAATNWITLIPFGSNWRYSTNPPVNWFSAAFNDSGWPMGPAKFGNGSAPTNITTRVAQFLPNYFFRLKFIVPTNNLQELLLSGTCTDVTPLQIYLNGATVRSSVDVDSLQGNETRYCDLTPFLSLLTPGTNVISVQLPNTWGSDYDDVAFDLKLQAMPYISLAPRLSVQCTSKATPQISATTPPGSVWQILSCDRSSAGAWQLMEVFTNMPGGTVLFPDTGQNGRVPPASAESRFYRLVPY